MSLLYHEDRIVGLSTIHRMIEKNRYDKPIFHEEIKPRITPTIHNRGGKTTYK